MFAMTVTLEPVVSKISDEKMNRVAELRKELTSLEYRRDVLMEKIMRDRVIMEEIKHDENNPLPLLKLLDLPFSSCFELDFVVDDIVRKRQELREIYY